MFKITIISVIAMASITAPVFADQSLAAAKNCFACHSIDKKLVGPAYRDIAQKYAGQKDAAGKLTTKIMKGGGGVWGAVPMPANTQVSEAEATRLIAWILSLQ